MAAFDKAFEKTLKYEGCLSNDVNDRGGLTKYGICQASYPKLDIRNLTIEDAKKIYKRDYWDAVECDSIKDESVAMHVFDIAVNCGTGGAGTIVQKAINRITGKTTLKVDGEIGNATISVLNTLAANVLNKEIARYRARRYAIICEKNKTQTCFLEGWLERTFGFVTF